MCIRDSTATADDKPINLVLQTGETDMAADDVIGKISFQAPDEGTGTDAILVSAAIQARAEGDHSSSSNATSLDFMTGASEAATKKWSITSAGSFLNAGTNTIDMNAGELILDANGNTSITADTDDQIDFKIGGTDQLVIGAQEMTWKAAGSPGFVVQDTTTPTTFKMTTNDSSGFINTTTNHPIEIRTNNTASMTIGAAGDIDVERGDIFFSTAGKGICLGVTSNTDSNTLDDYEEGTFTAAYTFGGSTTGITYGTNGQLGRYTKIGRIVICDIYIGLTSKGSQSGNVVVTGLPFTSVAHGLNTQSVASIGSYTGSWDLSANTHFTADVGQNSVVMALREGTYESDANPAAVTAAMAANDSQLYMSVTYEAT